MLDNQFSKNTEEVMKMKDKYTFFSLKKFTLGTKRYRT